MRFSRNATPRVVRPLLVGLLVAGLAMSWLPTAGAFDGPPTDLKGFANGQTAHAGAVESGGPEDAIRLADAEVAWAASSVDAKEPGLADDAKNEFNRIFQPAQDAAHTHARASGVEVGLATTPPDENQVIQAAKSESIAPPRSSDQDELVGLDADPLAFASVLRSNTVANWQESPLLPGVCVLGDDLSRGQAYAADVELLDGDMAGEDPEGLEAALVALNAQDPDRAVSQTTTRTRLVPTGKGPNNFGLMAETRETIAPVTILDVDGVPEELKGLTIELLGEWVLRVVATGHDGGATVHYGPGEASPNTPLLRVLNDAAEVLGELTTQMLFGDEGLDTGDLGIPTQLIEVVVGEDPRAIAAPGETPDDESSPALADDGTSASAAVDVLRIKLLNNLPDIELADIRIGHMEVSAQVPQGGVNCPIPVEKTANPDKIQINGSPDTSRLTITVHNVFDCDLEDVVLTDEIRQKEGDPDFQLVASDPTADSPDMPTGNLTEADVVWSLGTIKKGDSVSVTLDLKSATRGGIIRDIATAEGKLTNCTGSADVAVGLDVEDLTITGSSPEVEVAVETPRTGAAAASTTLVGSLLALGAIGTSWFIRRRRK